MLGKIKNLFAKSTPAPSTPAPPSSPLEVLVPDGARLAEPPSIAGKTLSFLVASPLGTNTIEFDAKGPRAHSSDEGLRKFLSLIIGAGQFTALVSQCRAIMYPPREEGSIGSIGCLQQGLLYSFDVFEHSPLPDIRWEIRRATRAVQGYGA